MHPLGFVNLHQFSSAEATAELLQGVEGGPLEEIIRQKISKSLYSAEEVSEWVSEEPWVGGTR